ncbi:alcohol dehydrogenase [Caldanaerovirga acetigignens]|uniref:Alcohol dehydrogenase n=1 Tax=Caldanaerovirga acetigignens TaxID=447595 RepID=A0A1M7LH91_9FIRM|nr:iron-containing alcohol dehydrogenase [Caldanaerovirga acetigignens]SHM77311.1 alcohol dehydrogenase [Caldanaerovirga acetigignens]
MDFGFFLPTKILFGRGKISEAGFYAKELGKRALIVTGKSSAKKTGSFEKLTKSLEDHGIEWILFDKVKYNPLTTDIDEGGVFARENKVDLVIGLGGGTAMDTAKGIAFAALNSGPMADYMEGKSGEKALPIILIPTTAGTGSEANNIAVMTNPNTMAKKGFRSPAIFAKVSIVDPELMDSLPPKIAASTGIDAFFHALESYISLRSNPLTESISLKAMELICENIKKAVYEPDKESRDKMAVASTLAGISLGQAGVCALHAMEHPLSSFFDVHHGEGLAPLARAFLNFVKPHAIEKLSKVADVMKINTAGFTEEQKAKEAINAIVEMINDLGLPNSISSFGVKKEDIQKLTSNVKNYMAHNLSATPGELTFEDIVRIYEESL